MVKSMAGKKSKSCPRRKRMNRQTRLQHARSTDWLNKYRGKDTIKGYCKWYGVDPVCALTELRMLGLTVSGEKEAEIRKRVEDQALARKRHKEHLAQKKQEPLFIDSDETFAFIAGYTSGGAPFGTRWEELEEEKIHLDF